MIPEFPHHDEGKQEKLMRSVTIKMPQDAGQKAVKIAQDVGALDCSIWQGKQDERDIDIVSVTIRNKSVDPLLNALTDLNMISITLAPYEVLQFVPPISKISDALKHIQNRSPIEIFLSALQSVGSWRDFLLQAIAGAIIVWIAFFTNSIYLLIAAMLVAPFANPAVGLALATATGDKKLFKQNISRYLAAILITVTVTAILALLFQQSFATNLMSNVGYVSSVSVLLPLTVGTASVLTLVQSEQSSLLSGTTIGILVAASLAPPAGLMGIALVIQDWWMVLNTGFILGLQLIGINLAGTIVFRLFKVDTTISQFNRGKKWIFYTGTTITVLALAGMLVWQFKGPIRLQKANSKLKTASIIESAIDGSDLIKPIEVTVETASTYQEESILATVYVQKLPGIPIDEDWIINRLRGEITKEIHKLKPDVVPYINIILLPPPEGQTSIPTALWRQKYV